jgi:hypothetical protein
MERANQPVGLATCTFEATVTATFDWDCKVNYEVPSTITKSGPKEDIQHNVFPVSSPPSSLPPVLSATKKSGKSRSRESFLKKSSFPRRPMNAFMLFAQQARRNKPAGGWGNHDNAQVSRLIGTLWNELGQDKQLRWKIQAYVEKLRHSKRHPNYSYQPKVHTQKGTTLAGQAPSVLSASHTNCSIVVATTMEQFMRGLPSLDDVEVELGSSFPFAFSEGIFPFSAAPPPSCWGGGVNLAEAIA